VAWQQVKQKGPVTFIVKEETQPPPQLSSSSALSPAAAAAASWLCTFCLGDLQQVRLARFRIDIYYDRVISISPFREDLHSISF
jgi:hypothetical protein